MVGPSGPSRPEKETAPKGSMSAAQKKADMLARPAVRKFLSALNQEALRVSGAKPGSAEHKKALADLSTAIKLAGASRGQGLLAQPTPKRKSQGPAGTANVRAAQKRSAMQDIAKMRKSGK